MEADSIDEYDMEDGTIIVVGKLPTGYVATLDSRGHFPNRPVDPTTGLKPYVDGNVKYDLVKEGDSKIDNFFVFKAGTKSQFRKVLSEVMKKDTRDHSESDWVDNLDKEIVKKEFEDVAFIVARKNGQYKVQSGLAGPILVETYEAIGCGSLVIPDLDITIDSTHEEICKEVIKGVNLGRKLKKQSCGGPRPYILRTTEKSIGPKTIEKDKCMFGVEDCDPSDFE